MKQRETCPFVTKMIQDKHGAEEVAAHMRECSVCQKIGDKLAFEVQGNLGFLLKDKEKPKDGQAPRPQCK